MLMLTPQAIAIIRSDQAKREERERIRRNRRVARRLNDDRTGRLVDNVARILRTGEPTHFQYEAACRHGLRQTLIFERWSWADADDTAAEIVARALDRIGAVRPTWEQGQPEAAANHSQARYYCARCGGPLDEHDRGRRKYCSKLCANAAGKERAAISGEAVSLAEYTARLALKREARLQASIGDCETCGKPFIGSRPGVRFCSKVCHAQSRRLHKARECPACGVTFQPVTRGKGQVQKFCSMACSAANRGPREKAPRPQLICEGCGSGFTSPYPSVKRRFCSLQCSSRRPRTRFSCTAVDQPEGGPLGA